MAFVFGYGSLAQPGAGRPLRLAGWRRVWGVAMDNRVTIPGYKYYLDEAGGRPAVRVAFLDVVPDPAACVDGVVVEVADLHWLDARERNYRRVEAAGLWLYTGLEEARERFAAGPTVVARAYLEGVRAALGAAFGPEPELPVIDLKRVDVPRGVGDRR
jgi:hypothetical protein